MNDDTHGSNENTRVKMLALICLFALGIPGLIRPPYRPLLRPPVEPQPVRTTEYERKKVIQAEMYPVPTRPEDPQHKLYQALSKRMESGDLVLDPPPYTNFKQDLADLCTKKIAPVIFGPTAEDAKKYNLDITKIAEQYAEYDDEKRRDKVKKIMEEKAYDWESDIINSYPKIPDDITKPKEILIDVGPILAGNIVSRMEGSGIINKSEASRYKKTISSVFQK